MANISTQSLYDPLVEVFGTRQGSVDFRTNFLIGLNSAVNRANLEADLASPITTPILDLEGTVGIDEKYQSYVRTVVHAELLKRGIRQRGDPKFLRTLPQLLRDADDAIDMIYVGFLNVKQSDEDNDVAGLGATTY